MTAAYVPDRGDIVWLDFDPRSGHEQSGHGPAVVLSPRIYNEKTSLILCCPMTTKIKGYPFEVLIGGEPPAAVLADQVKSLDWRAWKARKKGAANPMEIAEITAKAAALLGFKTFND